MKEMESWEDRKNSNPHIQEYIDKVIKKSWTYARLTDTEKALIYTALTLVKSRATTGSGVCEAVNDFYAPLLNAIKFQESVNKRNFY